MTAASPTTLDELRQFVHGRLCAMEGLLEDQFDTVETPVIRRGQPCGLQFDLRGPRAVRLGAVWASDRNELYVYDAQGQRAEKLTLSARISA